MQLKELQDGSNRKSELEDSNRLNGGKQRIKKSNLKPLMEILMIDCEKRSLNDMKQLRQILSDIESFKNIQSKPEFEYICRELTLIQLKNSEFLFQKDKGKLYIVLNGAVGIYTRDGCDSTLDVVHTYSPAQCFGELINPQVFKNSNTIALTLEDSTLGVISSNSYRRFKDIENSDLSAVQVCLQEFRAFHKMTNEQREQLSRKCTITKVPSNTVVIREGEIPKALFIVRKGILKMCRSVEFASCNESASHKNAFSYTTKTFCIKELKAGDYFPLNQLKNRAQVKYTVISVCPCQFVLVPYKEIENCLYLVEGEPFQLTDNQIRREFIENKEWNQYKSRYVKQIYQNMEARKNLTKRCTSGIKR